ncbi:MAG: hypothetical protein ACJ0GH_00595 [Alphaproteobacteria bacterium]|tara:strand:+ start:558 stop:788 length:231 start_codon:yes stop_codon:yes gene_type:complete
MLLNDVVEFILDLITLNTVYDASIYNLPITKLSINELQKKECRGKCPTLAIFDSMNVVLISKLDFNNLSGNSMLLH